MIRYACGAYFVYTRLQQVAAKPSQTMNEITRPAKRTKGSSSGKAAAAAGNDQKEEEEDFEMIGTKGGSELPHNRFSCPEVNER